MSLSSFSLHLCFSLDAIPNLLTSSLASGSYSDPDPYYLLCNNTRSGYRGNVKIPTALTISNTPVGGGPSTVPDQIIICQWYLDAALAAAYRDTGDFDDNFLTKSSQFWQYQQPPTGPPIDFFLLFDGTLAHEVSIRLGSFLASNPLPNADGTDLPYSDR